MTTSVPSSSPARPARYQLPTHLTQQDTLDISVLGIPLSLTLRQGVIVLIGWSCSVDLWHQLAWVEPLLPGGWLVRLSVPGVLALSVLFLATLQIQGRTAEAWLWLALRFWTRPRCYGWSSLAAAPLRVDVTPPPRGGDTRSRRRRTRRSRPPTRDQAPSPPVMPPPPDDRFRAKGVAEI